MRPPKRLSLLVSLALAATLAAGCGGSSSTHSGSGTATSGSSPTSAKLTPQEQAAQKRGQQATAIAPAVKKAAAQRGAKLAPAIVATVAGQPIALAQFKAAYQAQLAAFPGGAPDPPHYTHCIAAMKSQFAQLEKRMQAAAKSGPLAKAHKPAPKFPAPSEAKLRTQCAQRETSARTTAMTQLIEAAWTAGEAKARHVTVLAKQVDAMIAQQRKAFKTPARWAQYLKTTHTTEAALRVRLRQSLLNQKLSQARMGAAPKVSDAQVMAYFNAHRAQFGLPERRSVEVLLAKTQADAQRAKQAVKSGMKWAAAVKKWSIDPFTKATGGALQAVVKGSREPALDTLAFSSRPGVLAGPAKGQKGWYLARVTKVLKGTAPQIAPYKARIRALLAQQSLGQRAAGANAAYEKRWRAKTVCKPGYVVPLCANAPATS